MTILRVWLLLISQGLCNSYVQAQNCYGCVPCESSKGVIDLRSLAKPDGQYYSSDDDDYTYYFNPCSNGLVGVQSCRDGSAVCQVSSSNVAFSTGSADSETISIQDNDVTIQYTGGEDGRLSIVKLKCDQTAIQPFFKALGESVKLEYDFELTTKCACFDGCKGDSPDHPTNKPGGGGDSKKGGVAVGQIGISLIAVSPVLLLAYFIVGAVIMRTRYQHTGLDIIPQRSFWFDLPFLVKDGFMFTISPIIRLLKKDYEPIK